MAYGSRTPGGVRQSSAPALAPSAPSQPPVNSAVQQALDEYEQISQELAVVSPTVVQLALQAECAPGVWCLPDVSCSARDFMSEDVRQAFEDNHNACAGLTVL